MNSERLNETWSDRILFLSCKPKWRAANLFRNAERFEAERKNCRLLCHSLFLSPNAAIPVSIPSSGWYNSVSMSGKGVFSMKKIAALALVLALLFALCACGEAAPAASEPVVTEKIVEVEKEVL